MKPLYDQKNFQYYKNMSNTNTRDSGGGDNSAMHDLNLLSHQNKSSKPNFFPDNDHPINIKSQNNTSVNPQNKKQVNLFLDSQKLT